MHAACLAISTDIYDHFRWVIILKMQDPWWSENLYSNWFLISLLWPALHLHMLCKADCGLIGNNVWYWQHLVFHHTHDNSHDNRQDVISLPLEKCWFWPRQFSEYKSVVKMQSSDNSIKLDLTYDQVGYRNAKGQQTNQMSNCNSLEIANNAD